MRHRNARRRPAARLCLFPSQSQSSQASNANVKTIDIEYNKNTQDKMKLAMDGIARYRWVDKLTNWKSWWFNNWLRPSNFRFLPRWDFGGYSQPTNLSLGLHHASSMAGPIVACVHRPMPLCIVMTYYTQVVMLYRLLFSMQFLLYLFDS